MSGKTDNLDTGVFCSLSSDNPFQTTLRCYSSPFRQYMVECQTYTHACYRNECRISCQPQQELFLSCTDCKDHIFLCQGQYFRKKTLSTTVNSRKSDFLIKQLTPGIGLRVSPGPSKVWQGVMPRWHCPEPVSTYPASMKKIAGYYLKSHS